MAARKTKKFSSNFRSYRSFVERNFKFKKGKECFNIRLLLESILKFLYKLNSKVCFLEKWVLKDKNIISVFGRRFDFLDFYNKRVFFNEYSLKSCFLEDTISDDIRRLRKQSKEQADYTHLDYLREQEIHKDLDDDLIEYREFERTMRRNKEDTFYRMQESKFDVFLDRKMEQKFNQFLDEMQYSENVQHYKLVTIDNIKNICVHIFGQIFKQFAVKRYIDTGYLQIHSLLKRPGRPRKLYLPMLKKGVGRPRKGLDIEDTYRLTEFVKDNFDRTTYKIVEEIIQAIGKKVGTNTTIHQLQDVIWRL